MYKNVLSISTNNKCRGQYFGLEIIFISPPCFENYFFPHSRQSIFGSFRDLLVSIFPCFALFYSFTSNFLFILPNSSFFIHFFYFFSLSLFIFFPQTTLADIPTPGGYFPIYRPPEYRNIRGLRT
jgi:hypothetical protein